MRAEEYLDDLRGSRVLDPTNVAVIKGFIAAYESCKGVDETVKFVSELRSIVGSQFLEQLSRQVRADPALTQRYLKVVNQMLEQIENA